MAKLELVFKGSDETKAAVSDVAGGLHDVGEAAEGASQKGGGLFSNLLSTAGGFLAANVVGAIAGQFTSFIGGAISDARDANKLMAETEQIIKTSGSAAGITAEQVADLAGSLSAAAGKSLFGDDQIQGAENVLLKYKELKGIIPDVTRLSVDMAQRLGTEPAAAAEGLGRALQNPFEAEAKLAKQGIILDEQQKAMLATFKATGDTAGAQKFLIDELNKSFGGSAEAAAKADGGWAQMQDRLGEAGETIGQLLLPVIGLLIDGLNDYVLPAIEAVVNGIGPFIESFQAAGASSGELGEALGELGDIWTLLSEVIDLQVQLILAIVMPAFEEISAFLAAHGEEIDAILSAVWTVIKTTIEVTLTVVKGIITAALQIIKGDWSGAWETIKTMFADVWDGIKTILSAELEIAKNLLSMAWDSIKGTVESAWDGIKSTVSDAVSDLVDTIMGLPDQVAGVGEAVVGAIQDGIEGAWDRLVNWFDNKLAELRAKLPFSEPKDSSSPLYGLSKSGTAIITNLLEGLEDAIPDLLSAVTDMAGDVAGQVQDMADQVSGALADAFDASAAIDRQAAKNIDAVRKFAADLQGGVQSELDKALEESRQIQDPAEAEAYYSMRSDQILEIGKIQQDLMDAQQAGDEQAIADAQQKLDLIQQAQQAEQKAFAERQKGQSQTEQFTEEALGFQAKLTAQAGAIQQQLLDRHLKGDARASLEAQLAQIQAAQQAFSPIATLIAQLANVGGQLSGGAPVLIPPAPMGMQGLLAGGAGGGANAVGGGGPLVGQLTINQLPGENADQLADRILRKLDERRRGYR